MNIHNYDGALLAKKLGFKTCIVPSVTLKSIGKVDGIEVIGVSSVNQAMNYI